MAVSSASDRVLSDEGDGEAEPSGEEDTQAPEPGSDTLQAQSGREQIAFEEGADDTPTAFSDDTTKDPQS